MPSEGSASQNGTASQLIATPHRPESATPQPIITPGGPLTPGAITAAVKTELNINLKTEMDARSTPLPDQVNTFNIISQTENIIQISKIF